MNRFLAGWPRSAGGAVLAALSGSLLCHPQARAKCASTQLRWPVELVSVEVLEPASDAGDDTGHESIDLRWPDTDSLIEFQFFEGEIPSIILYEMSFSELGSIESERISAPRDWSNP